MPPPTFLENYVRNNVCSHKTSFSMPVVPAILFANVFEPVAFACAWGLVFFVWIVIWLVLPCNPNLNCTATLTNGNKQGKDGTKALLVSFLIVYAILFAVAVTARLIVCESPDPKPNRYGGGLVSNIFGAFGKKVPIGGEKAAAKHQLDQIVQSKINSIVEHVPSAGSYRSLASPQFGNLKNSFH
jgi:hypothetical protein